MEIEALIIDDDDIIAFIHERMLIDSELHLHPKSFLSAELALTHLERWDGQRYLIFLDINMPEMNGWQFIEALSTLPIYKQLAVFIGSSSVNTTDRNKSKLYPCVFDYLEKPLNKEKIKDLQQSEAFRLFYAR